MSLIFKQKGSITLLILAGIVSVFAIFALSLLIFNSQKKLPLKNVSQINLPSPSSSGKKVVEDNKQKEKQRQLLIREKSKKYFLKKANTNE